MLTRGPAAPVLYAVGNVTNGMSCTAYELGLEAYLSAGAFEFVQPIAQPDVTVGNLTNPKQWKSLASRPYTLLPLADLVTLSEDPSKRLRWTQLFTHVTMPPLRLLADVITTKV